MTTSLTTLAAKAPAYCSSGHGVLTPAQWKTCWNAGWSQPVTNAANSGAIAGHSVVPWMLLVGVIIGVILLASRSRSGTPATN